MSLNAAAYALVRPFLDRPELIGAASHRRGGAWILDCGVAEAGGVRAGLLMAEAALAGLGSVHVVPAAEAAAEFGGDWPAPPWPVVVVRTTAPLAACLAAQYAGWKVASGGYFAMASGPIRAAIGREPLYDRIGHRERPDVAVGVLESAHLPPEAVCLDLAADAGVAPDRLVLLVARTASVAGGLQVVARSVETALHKLADLGFDLSRIEAGVGAAPVPPVPDDDLEALGRTNDSVLYGARVTLDVTGDDDSLAAIGPRCVSRSSASWGEPFRTIFDRAGRDFYAVDPAVFAPAVVEFANRGTGRRQRFGELAPAVLATSFATGPVA
ncbi:MAG: methenyltetrahydromethanopterin cyclohydrolase [Planctomycetota bacterium]